MLLYLFEPFNDAPVQGQQLIFSQFVQVDVHGVILKS
jgi:hypothetical protein